MTDKTEEVVVLGGQARVVYDGDDCKVSLRHGKYSGWTSRFGAVRFEEVGDEMILRYDIDLMPPEDDPDAVPGDDFSEYFGELLTYLMLLVADGVMGTDWERYELE